MWAKCDMLATVGLARLDRVRWKKDYQAFQLNAADLTAILRGVKAALGLT